MSPSRATCEVVRTALRSVAEKLHQHKIALRIQPFLRHASKLPPPVASKRAIPNVQHLVLVGSGKGGVGKSTTAGVRRAMPNHECSHCAQAATTPVKVAAADMCSECCPRTGSWLWAEGRDHGRRCVWSFDPSAAQP